MTCLYRRTFKCGGLAYLRPKFGPPWGSRCGGLGYESKCWVGFDSQLDMFMSRIGVGK